MLAAMRRRTAGRSTIALVALAACDPAPASDPTAAQAAALLTEVRRADYRSWARPPEWPERTAGRAPHGAFTDVWLDATIVSAIDRGDPLDAWPEGSTVVADGWHDAAGEDLAAIQIMRKQDGAWWWAQYAADDTPLVWGISLACTHCHQAGHDFVRSVELPE